MINVHSENYKKDINRIANHYGFAQYGQMIEECAELIVAIRKYQRYIGSMKTQDEDFEDKVIELKGDIEEEIADVQVMIDQLKILLPAHDFRKFVNYKVERQIQRINQEKGLVYNGNK